MKKARFFETLHLARVLKDAGDTKQERWEKLFWFQRGYFFGWLEKQA